MEKILLLIDGAKLDIAALDFACYIARLTNSQLTGAFLEDLDYIDAPVPKEVNGNIYLDQKWTTDLPQNAWRRQVTEERVTMFKDACIAREVRWKIHHDRGNPIDEVKTESKYADLIIIDAETSFKAQAEPSPTKFVKDVLEQSSCPVVVTPESFEQLDELVFAYDGAESSLYAIKQFAYLLPQLRSTKLKVVEISRSDKHLITGQYKLKEWLGMHFDDVEFVPLVGDEYDELLAYLAVQTNAMLIIGSYGRSAISKLLYPSHADPILQTLALPVFIAHQ